MRTLGFVLIVAGILMILVRGFNVPVRKNIVEVGPLEISKTDQKWIGWPTYAGGFMAIAGIAIVMSSRKK